MSFAGPFIQAADELQKTIVDVMKKRHETGIITEEDEGNLLLAVLDYEIKRENLANYAAELEKRGIKAVFTNPTVQAQAQAN